MKSRMTKLAFAAFLLLVAEATCLLAAEPTRVLNGHAFIPSEVVRAPFALSHFSTRTGGGIAFGLKTPFVDVDGSSLGTLEGDVGFMALGFEYQQRFGNWFAGRVSFNGSGRIGIDEQSILAQGVSGAYVFSFGGTGRILQSEKVILSGALDFSNSQLIGVDPFGFASTIIEEGLEADNDLVASSDSYNTKLGVLVGWAPMDWLGLTGVLEGGRGQVSSSDANVSVGGGATVGVDFKSLDLIPIGFQFLAKTDAFSEAGADLTDRTWAYGLGISYTGWDDFSLSMETTMNVLERRDQEDDFEAFMVTFNLRYWPH
jgi:hypothetical protein